jgi:hypothetical protein
VFNESGQQTHPQLLPAELGLSAADAHRGLNAELDGAFAFRGQRRTND